MVGIDAASVSASRGQFDEATRQLQSVLEQAQKYGYAGYDFQALLGLGEIELKSGRTSKGRMDLIQLAKDAKARGFGLIAGKARKGIESKEQGTRKSAH